MQLSTNRRERRVAIRMLCKKPFGNEREKSKCQRSRAAHDHEGR